MIETSTIIITVVILFFIFILKAIKVVPEGYEWIVEYFGKPKKETLEPGIHFIVPFISKIRARVNMKEQTIFVPPQLAITKDNITIRIDNIIFYMIADPYKAVYESENLNKSIIYALSTNIREIIGEIKLEDMYKDLDSLNDKLYEALDVSTNQLGCKIIRVETTDIIPPQDVRDAWAKKLEIEKQKKLAEENEKIITQKQKKNVENSEWINIFEKSCKFKSINEILSLFDKNVEYYKNSTTRLYNIREIEEDWNEILDDDYPRISMNVEMQEGDCFILSIKVNIHSIIAKIKLNAEGKCTYFKKWQES